MSWDTNCVETIRIGENYYLLKAGAYELGPLAVISVAEYQERLQRSRDHKMEWPGGEVTSNIAYMFMGRQALIEQAEHATPVSEYIPEVVRSEGEKYAYARTVDEGLVDELQDGAAVIAKESLIHLNEFNPYAASSAG